MWRVSDDFSGTRISYGYKLWLIAWMLLTDWTFRLEYCLQSPNRRTRAGRLDITSKNMPHEVQNKDNYTLHPQKSIIRNYENNIKE